MMIPKIKTPTEAMTIQERIESFYSTNTGLKFLVDYFQHRKASGVGELGAQFETRRVSNADTYYVSAEMLELAEHAAKSMPDEAIIPEDLPSRLGFMVLETPTIARDIHGKTCSISAYLWGAHNLSGYGDALVVSMYNNLDDLRDEYNQELIEEMKAKNPKMTDMYLSFNLPHGQFVLHTMGVYKFNHEPEKFLREAAEYTQANSNICKDDPALAMELTRESYYSLMKLPLAIWALMRQRLAVVEKAKPDRATRRQLVREKKAHWSRRDIKIITLRKLQKPTSSTGEKKDVEWSHKWVVSGHWRNQWFPSLNMHRSIWIHPFVKGPEDKPLQVKKTIRRLVR